MLTTRPTVLACIAMLAAGSVALAQTPPTPPVPFEPQSGQAGKDVVWVPTADALVARMLELADLKPDDYLMDLGSGDGRTVIAAAKRGATAKGIEFNGDMVALARRRAEAEGVATRATFEQADIFQTDLSRPTVITLFLLTTLNQKLRPSLLELKPGTRIVSNTFDMGDWQPDARAEAGEGCTTFCRALKWTVPAKVAGTWKLENGSLELAQTYQMLSGQLTQGGQATPISNAKMDGDTIRFSAGGRTYQGQVKDGTVTGTVEGGGTWTATRSAT